MDEKILLRFEDDRRPMKLAFFDENLGIAFDKPKDASPLIIAIGLQSLLPGRLDPVRQRHDWRNKEFALDAVLHDGGLLLSGRDGDREGLPFGAYDITVEVESYRFKNDQQRVVIPQNTTVEIVVKTKPDRRIVELLDNFDNATANLVNNSAIEEQKLTDWLTDESVREVRKSCLLNVLTKLAAPPVPELGERQLTPRFNSVHFADVDRVYAVSSAALGTDLEEFVEGGGWVFEGAPAASIHQRVIADALNRFPGLSGKTSQDFTLASYRQGGRNCLQIVIAAPKFPHPNVYADIDIDLGNPLWDLEGLCVHLGELLDPGRTDHFDVYKKLRKGPTADFVFYKVT